MDVMRFGTWNVRSLYVAGSFAAADRELGRYKLELMVVQGVRWDGEGTIRAGNCSFVHVKRNKNHQF